MEVWTHARRLNPFSSGELSSILVRFEPPMDTFGLFALLLSKFYEDAPKEVKCWLFFFFFFFFFFFDLLGARSTT